MNPFQMLTGARRHAGLSQHELARRAGTSRPTLSAYEHGRRSPTLQTASRVLAAAGFELTAVPRIDFSEHPIARGRTVAVASSLPRLEPAQALATITLPLHLNWSAPARRFDLRNRADRARVYEIVLREGAPEDILAYVDGVLLVDIWGELVLPRDVRAAWTPVIEQAQPAAA